MDQQTEYKTKKVQISGFTENGREKEFLKTKERLAEDGWELISFEDNGMSNTFATFKRPIGYKSTNKNLLKNTLSISVIVIILWAIISSVNNLPKSEKPIDPKENLRSKVSLETKNLKMGGFGNVFITDLIINNESNKTVKDIEIECECYGKSGTHLQKLNHIIYDTFPANKKKRLKEVNMGFVNSQAQRFGCEIKDFAIQ